MTIDQIEITPSGPIQTVIRPPSSKSITNRALICAALATGQSSLLQPLESDDTRVMIESLNRLGIRCSADTEQRLSVRGQGGAWPSSKAELFIGNSGTSVRFLTAMVSVGHGDFTIDGVARMRERPIQHLLDALNHLGGHAVADSGRGCPPVRVQARGLNGGVVSIRGDISSQFLSGLMMAAPYARQPITIKIEGQLVSRPYVRMTLAVMSAFGIDVGEEQNQFQIPAGRYSPCEYEVEPDASAASYFWAAAAITGGEAEIVGLTRNSLQGDVAFCDLLVRMGCELEERPQSMIIRRRGPLRGIECDMSHISDTAQTLSAVALFASGTTTIRGIAHNRLKETDRIGNLAIELRRFGADVEERSDGLRITPPATVNPATIDTYEDHRMAMSLALPGLKVPGVIIKDPNCTSKTYPQFFHDLAAACTR